MTVSISVAERRPPLRCDVQGVRDRWEDVGRTEQLRQVVPVAPGTLEHAPEDVSFFFLFCDSPTRVLTSSQLTITVKS